MRSVEFHSLEESPADSLKNGPLDLVPEPLRIDDPATGHRDDDSGNTDASAAPVDFDLCNDSGAFLRAVLAEGDSATAHHRLAGIRPRRWPRLPAGLLYRGLQHLQGHRILEIATAEFDWIHLLVRRDFVNKGFNSEVALYASGCPKIDRPEKLFDEMTQHPCVGEFIGGRIGTSRQALPIRVPPGEAPGQGIAGLASGMTLRPLLKIERRDMTLPIQAGPNVHRHCRTHGFPTVLVMAHPLYPYRSSDRLRQQCRISGGIVTTQPSV